MSHSIARVIAKQLPGRRDSGGRQRLAAFVEAYSRIFDEVVVYGFGEGGFELDNVAVKAFGPPSLNPLELARRSVFAAKWRCKSLADHFAADVRPTDFVHVDFPQMAANLPSGVRPDVLDFHNIEAELMASRTGHYSRWARVPLNIEIARLSRFETKQARTARLVTACSVADVEKLRSCGARAVLVPNGVAGMPPTWPPMPRNGQVGFVGSMDYEPNQEGVAWLVAEVWPLIHRENRDARLLIAGRNAGLVQSIADNDATITLLDSPSSIATAYEQCDVCVVPLRSGAGTKIKLLEALAYGRPVVSTSVGLEGLDEVRGLVSAADEPSAFAQEVSILLRTPELPEMSERLYKRASTAFGWEARLAGFSELVSHERRMVG